MNWIFANTRRAPAILLLAALVVQTLPLLVWSEASRRNVSSDYTQFYDPVARSLLAGKGFHTPDGSFAALYPPGYPILLAALFGIAETTGLPEEWFLRLSIAASAVASSLLVFAIARPWLGARVALWAGLLWTFYPFQVYLARQPNPETPFTVLMLAALLAALSLWRPAAKADWRWAAASGALLALATLIRPITLFLPLVLLALAFWFQRSAGVVRMIPLVAAFALVIAPWQIAAHAALGRWIPVSTNGPYSMFDGLTFALAAKGSGQVLDVDPAVRAFMQSVWDDRYELPTVGSMIRYTAGYAAHDPAAVAKLLLLKSARALYATNAQWYETQTLLLQIPFILLYAVGLVRGARRRVALPLLAVAAAVPLYFWMMALLVLPILRYLVPALALATIPVALLLDDMLSRLLHLEPDSPAKPGWRAEAAR